MPAGTSKGQSTLMVVPKQEECTFMEGVTDEDFRQTVEEVNRKYWNVLKKLAE
jgi:hypothetical protein